MPGEWRAEKNGNQGQLKPSLAMLGGNTSLTARRANGKCWKRPSPVASEGAGKKCPEKEGLTRDATGEALERQMPSECFDPRRGWLKRSTYSPDARQDMAEPRSTRIRTSKGTNQCMRCEKCYFCSRNEIQEQEKQSRVANGQRHGALSRMEATLLLGIDSAST